METGKLPVILAVIAMISGWGTAAITNWDKLGGGDEVQGGSGAHASAVSAPPDDQLRVLEQDIRGKESELSQLHGELEMKRQEVTRKDGLLQEKDREIARLKEPFHNISNSKLRQLLMFHNQALCYGATLNFTHPAAEEHSHCVKKEVLARRFISFLEELGIVTEDVGMDYSRSKAKNELVALQEQYKFKETGWYGEYMLAILIIEYAKKSG